MQPSLLCVNLGAFICTKVLP
uniref:Uncharacterized protein n=1 Tax=Anguilla anguilla TaxID=7936 RepID=A0A0E9T7X2_ANGAN